MYVQLGAGLVAGDAGHVQFERIDIPDALFRLSCRADGAGGVSVSARGEVDTTAGRLFEEAVMAERAGALRRLALDLGSVSFSARPASWCC
ncbi:hypothetical protein OG738_09460 [Amycolatopsis sp. NBC_01488]|uniref:hypothetical protein n=1 Tax=Amycolatopsis sp. NBC_01488 TaxID=2903563 RepID=UPI002E2BE1BD|nr:hypothetical protein [Amycolatopsis sp. NBC_01488]